MQVLLTDIMFPNKYAKWRLVEIKSFMEEYQSDILVINRINSYSNIVFDFDWALLLHDFLLDQYDILIFNPDFNYINQYNTRIDGTVYNGMIQADYLLRHKSRASFSFSVDQYDVVYHIFLMCYQAFNSRFTYPHHKQVIHLYPGGGYLNSSCMSSIHPDVKLISTQQFISKNITDQKYINVYGGPFYYKNEIITVKEKTSSDLCVCFTSMGNPIEKGANLYHQIVSTYHATYPNDSIRFISIGNCPPHPFITSYSPMDQLSLSTFYNYHVDILINLDTGVAINGFPLGIEAVKEGCMLLTTDVHHQNSLNNFNFDPFIIIDKNCLSDVIDKIKLLTNKTILSEKSKQLQEHIYHLFNYDNTMAHIFTFIIACFLPQLNENIIQPV
jgi:hypothetical protein